MELEVAHLVGATVQCFEQLRPLFHFDDPAKHFLPWRCTIRSRMHDSHFGSPSIEV